MVIDNMERSGWGFALTVLFALCMALASTVKGQDYSLVPDVDQYKISPYTPPPEPVQQSEGMVDVGDVSLWYWDTGGEGEVVIFSHANTGSGLVWAYQQPVLANAGYRVIGYSRRGHANSGYGPGEGGSGADDLLKIMDALDVDKAHFVAVAAGGYYTVDFAIQNPERVQSLFFQGSIIGPTDPEYAEVTRILRPEGFSETPPSFRELHSSYRAFNPEGAQVWEALESISKPNNGVAPPSTRREYAMAEIAEALDEIPTVLMTGDGDLYAPPALYHWFHENWPTTELMIVPNAGHSVYWEKPGLFNRTLLSFLVEHSIEAD